MADCSDSGLTEIPLSLPAYIDWLILSSNKISNISNTTLGAKILTHISALDLKGNSLDKIPRDFLEIFALSSNLVSLDISKNNLTSLPKFLKNVSSVKAMWISGNPFKCECDNMWMKQWILNNSNAVKDYKKAYCRTASGKKTDIIHMSEIDLGCVPKEKHEFPTWQITGNNI